MWKTSISPSENALGVQPCSCIAVVLPVGQLLLESFFKFFGFYQLDMLTFDNYRAFFQNDELWYAVVNTAIAGVVGATLTMVLGSIVA